MKERPKTHNPTMPYRISVTQNNGPTIGHGSRCQALTEETSCRRRQNKKTKSPTYKKSCTKFGQKYLCDMDVGELKVAILNKLRVNSLPPFYANKHSPNHEKTKRQLWAKKFSQQLGHCIRGALKKVPTRHCWDVASKSCECHACCCFSHAYADVKELSTIPRTQFLS